MLFVKAESGICIISTNSVSFCNLHTKIYIMKSCKIYGYQLQDRKEYATVQGGLLCKKQSGCCGLEIICPNRYETK